MRLYEGMYIVTTELASQGWESVEETVSETITRFDGEIVRMRKWSEREFTHTIKDQNKGVYVLVHFKADPSVIKEINRRIKISPDILRILIVRIDEEYAEKSFAREPEEKRLTIKGTKTAGDDDEEEDDDLDDEEHAEDEGDIKDEDEDEEDEEK